MTLTRWFLTLPALVAAAIVFVPAGVARRTDSAPQTGAQAKNPPSVENEIIQEFPGADGARTAWKVHYLAARPRPGMMITAAWFKTAPSEEWFQVLGEVRLSEIFVPYDNGTRIYDIGAQGNYSLLKHTAEDAGPHGKLLNGGLVVQEIRDLGPLWKYYGKVRRAQDLVLWSTFGAGNYNYITEYSFRGDG